MFVIGAPPKAGWPLFLCVPAGAQGEKCRFHAVQRLLELLQRAHKCSHKAISPGVALGARTENGQDTLRQSRLVLSLVATF